MLWKHAQNWWVYPLNLYLSSDVVGWFGGKNRCTLRDTGQIDLSLGGQLASYIPGRKSHRYTRREGNSAFS